MPVALVTALDTGQITSSAILDALFVLISLRGQVGVRNHLYVSSHPSSLVLILHYVIIALRRLLLTL